MNLTYDTFLELKSKKKRTAADNKLLSDFFINLDISFEGLFNSETSLSLWPTEFTVNVGYEPSGEQKYLSLKNEKKINIFESCSIHGPVKYVLFLIENGKYIAVDGSDMENSWDLSQC